MDLRRRQGRTARRRCTPSAIAPTRRCSTSSSASARRTARATGASASSTRSTCAPADIPRFGALGVIASMQPYHAIDDGRWAERRSAPNGSRTTYAFRALLDRGARLAFGSDWYVAPPTPLEGIYAAVTRRTLDDKHPGGWVPEQKITVEEALRAYTAGGAYASFQERENGTIAPGMLADITVIDRDLRAIPARGDPRREDRADDRRREDGLPELMPATAGSRCCPPTPARSGRRRPARSAARSTMPSSGSRPRSRGTWSDRPGRVPARYQAHGTRCRGPADESAVVKAGSVESLDTMTPPIQARPVRRIDREAGHLALEIDRAGGEFDAMMETARGAAVAVLNRAESELRVERVQHLVVAAARHARRHTVGHGAAPRSGTRSPLRATRRTPPRRPP